jgi:hypothetical protein
MNFDGYNTLQKDVEVPNENIDILIRQSTINSMELCPARIGYQDDEGYIKPFSEPLIFGNLVHECIALAIADDNMLTTVLSIGHVLDAILETEYELLDSSHNPLLTDTVSEASFALTEWWKWWEREHVTHPVTEHEMYAQLGTLADGRIIWLYGTPDYYSLDTLTAKDWKTAGRGWGAGKADHAIQASLYSHLIFANTGTLIKDWEFLVYNRRKGVWESHRTYRNRAQIESAKKVAWQRGLMLAHQIFPATPTVTENFKTKRGWYCQPKFCPAWNICEFKHLADSMDEDQIKQMEI